VLGAFAFLEELRVEAVQQPECPEDAQVLGRPISP
jgi:hypothetical protein